ncbi:Protein CBG10926 [Caenorhabditis briggsae]|uniref:Protein CBG10926 n=1 Tax=Caenorhabditis briggsae TaxID=6238 RepID=A8XCA3_CAEBR|nr:Protein CBG10926 [Caenorhabditis briggsae]CAP30201.2 Protein CBG10926 [Caenorhabditis briggsae]
MTVSGYGKMYLLQIVIFSLVTAYCRSALYDDYRHAQFIRDWAAHCVDKYLPKYDAQEVGPEIRKCDTERCVYFMYKYIADNLPEKFLEFDICFETNTARKSSRSPSTNPEQHYTSRS